MAKRWYWGGEKCRADQERTKREAKATQFKDVKEAHAAYLLEQEARKAGRLPLVERTPLGYLHLAGVL